MKITTLIENHSEKRKDLYTEHGLSMFIETDSCSILFDTGKTGNFIYNAEKLGLDLNSVNYLVLSHAHYDHCGGVKKLLENFNIKPEFFISKHFFTNSNKYHLSKGENKFDFTSENPLNYIGIDFNGDFIKDKKIKTNYIDSKMTKLTNNVYIFSNFTSHYAFENLNPNMRIKEGENLEIDTFKDEIVLALDTGKGLVVLLGCSHPGVLNILKSIKECSGKEILAVLGGTHLIEASDDRINKTIDELKNMNINIIGVSHCTGESACKKLKSNFQNFFVNCTGTTTMI